jgi:predicted Zn-dependent peptidase
MKHTVSEISLRNGVKGLLVNIPDATVMTMEINFRAGEYLVPKKKMEVPHLMEHLLLGANELIPRARDFQAEFQKNGAYNNASTSVYDITYEAECADFEWDRTLGMMLIAITKPLFLEEEFRAEYGNVREEMMSRANSHFRQLGLVTRKQFGLIAKTDAERIALMPNVTVEDVRAHYLHTHVSANMRFVIAGNLTPKRQSTIESLLANVELRAKGKRFELPLEKPRTVKKPVYIHNKSVENLYFYIDTFMRRPLSDPEADALNLLNTMLTETLYSKILGTARERGLVYGMSSGVSPTRNLSNWWFGAQVSDKNAAALFSIITNEIGKVLTGDVSGSDIEATKQYALGRFQRSAQTVLNTANGYAGRYFFDGVIEEYSQVPERIKAVDKDTIVGVTRAMLADNVWGIGVLGDCGRAFVDKLRQQLEPLWQTTKA